MFSNYFFVPGLDKGEHGGFINAKIPLPFYLFRGLFCGASLNCYKKVLKKTTMSHVFSTLYLLRKATILTQKQNRVSLLLLNTFILLYNSFLPMNTTSRRVEKSSKQCPELQKLLLLRRGVQFSQLFPRPLLALQDPPTT